MYKHRRPKTQPVINLPNFPQERRLNCDGDDHNLQYNLCVLALEIAWPHQVTVATRSHRQYYSTSAYEPTQQDITTDKKTKIKRLRLSAYHQKYDPINIEREILRGKNSLFSSTVGRRMSKVYSIKSTTLYKIRYTLQNLHLT